MEITKALLHMITGLIITQRMRKVAGLQPFGRREIESVIEGVGLRQEFEGLVRRLGRGMAGHDGVGLGQARHGRRGTVRRDVN